MRFSYSISYIPGIILCTADALSRFPLRDVSSSLLEIDAFVAATLLRCHYVMPSLMIFAQRQQQILRYSRCYVTVRQGCLTSKNLSPDVPQFAHSRDHLTECDGLVMYDARIVILVALRDKMLQTLHDAHQGIAKMWERARTSLWWPKIDDDIERIASSCVTCAHWRTPPAEPLLPTPLPDLPW